MKKKPKLLVIGYCYPPTSSPEGFVTAKLLRNIPDCTIDVLTAETGILSSFVDESMGRYAEQINGTVYRVKVSGWVRKLCSLPQLPFRPDRWLFLNRTVYKKACDLRLGKHFDCLVTRSQYHSAHLVGLRLKKRFPKTPWVACFSDPWSDADHQTWIPGFSTWSDYQERKVLKNADQLIFPSEGLRDHFTKGAVALNAKSTVLPHSFDPVLYGGSPEKRSSNGRALVARVFGSFYGARSPDVLFSAIDRLPLDEGTKLTLEVFGPWHASYEKLEDKYNGNSNKCISYEGHIPHIDALKKMQEADLLVLVDAPGDGRSFYLPSKLIDYLGAGRTILSICRPGVVQEITERSGGIVCAESDPDDVSQKIQSWIRSVRLKQPEGSEVYDEYSAQCVGVNFESLVSRVINEKNIGDS